MGIVLEGFALGFVKASLGALVVALGAVAHQPPVLGVVGVAGGDIVAVPNKGALATGIVIYVLDDGIGT